MRILFNLGSMTKGGAERVVANLSDYFTKVGNEVAIVISTEKSSYYELNEKVELYGLDDAKKSNNFIFKNFFRIKKLKNIIKIEKPDIIVSFLPEPSYRLLLLKLFNRKLKVIVSVRNDPKVEYKSIVSKMIMKLLYPLADGFVFQTDEAKEYFDKKIQDNSIVIPNPLGQQFVDAKTSEKKEKIIISVGRLEPQKNQKNLIEAFGNIADEIPEYKLVIYGEGPLRNELESLIIQKKMENRVLLPGNTNSIIEELNKSEIFVLSSDYEGMPNALMEAMAMGLACISTDCPCGGPKYLIENDYNGILINVNDVDAIGNSIKLLIDNENMRRNISKNCMNIRERLKPQKIYNIWEEYIYGIGGKYN